jgi:hypothetical protein
VKSDVIPLTNISRAASAWVESASSWSAGENDDPKYTAAKISKIAAHARVAENNVAGWLTCGAMAALVTWCS